MILMRSVIPAICSGLLLFFLLYAPPLSLFPQNDTQFEFIPVTNNEQYLSATKAEMDVDHGHLHFRYTLDSTIANPYAVLLLHAHELERSVDLSRHDVLNIEVDPLECSDFTVTLYLYEEGLSDLTRMETHRPVSIKCRTEKGKKRYSFPLSDFATPHEWYLFMNVRPEDLSTPSWATVSHLAFTHFDESQMGTEQALTISGLGFTDTIGSDLFYSILFSVFMFTLLYVIQKWIRKQKNLKIKRKIYYSKDIHCSNELGGKLLDFFHKEYTNPLFSQQLIEKELGIKPVIINDLLSSEVGSSYKKYLNSLRIDKAKYLLSKSDLSISDIASEVGYCYANSFSRAFRNIVGCTPNEFRREHVR